MGMDFNQKPGLAYVSQPTASVLPQSVAAAATVTGASWVSVKEFKWAKVTALVGAGAGSLAVKLQQATSSGGAGAKDLITAANLGLSAVLTAAGSAQADCNIDANIDVDNSFAYIQVSATVTGGAGTLCAVHLELGPAVRVA